MRTSYFAVIAFTLFLIAIIGVSLYVSSPKVSVSENSYSLLETPFSFAIAESCDVLAGDSSELIGGTIHPGQCCKKNADCWSNKCGCTRGMGTADRCCHYGSGQSCQDNDECESGSCVNGKCATGKRPNGASCSVNEDCQSDKCIHTINGYKCQI